MQAHDNQIEKISGMVGQLHELKTLNLGYKIKYFLINNYKFCNVLQYYF